MKSGDREYKGGRGGEGGEASGGGQRKKPRIII